MTEQAVQTDPQEQDEPVTLGPAPAAIAPPAAVVWVLRLLALAGLGLSAYLSYIAMQAGAVGCGAEGCDQVIHTSYGKVLGVPVGIPTGLMYLAVLVASVWLTPSASALAVRRAWQVLVIAAVLAIGGAIWFTFVQRYQLGAFCPFCMFTHAVGLIFAVVVFAFGPLPWALAGYRSGAARAQLFDLPHALSLLAVGLLGIVVLVSVQTLLPSHVSTMTVARVGPGGYAMPELKPGQVMLTVPRGVIIVEPGNYPMTGPADAEHILLVLYDYTCPHCRLLHTQMDDIVARYGRSIGFVMLPMPLDADCNPIMTQTQERHQNACEYAKLAIAMWHAKPEAYDEMTDFLMQGDTPPDLPAAREKANELLDGNLDEALANPAVDRQLAHNIKLYEVTRGGPLPKLIGDSLLILGRPDSLESFHAVLEEELKVAPVNGEPPASPDAAGASAQTL